MRSEDLPSCFTLRNFRRLDCRQMFDAKNMMCAADPRHGRCWGFSEKWFCFVVFHAGLGFVIKKKTHLIPYQ